MPELWGVLNVTPDSFSDGGSFVDTSVAVAAGLRMVDDNQPAIPTGPP